MVVIGKVLEQKMVTASWAGDGNGTVGFHRIMVHGRD